MEITPAVLDDIALGAALLGTGGGGDPYIGMLMARQALERYGSVELLDADDLDDDDLVIPTAMMGATLFFVSDALLGWNRFVRPLRWAPVGIMTTYHLGQAGLVLSLLG